MQFIYLKKYMELLKWYCVCAIFMSNRYKYIILHPKKQLETILKDIVSQIKWDWSLYTLIRKHPLNKFRKEIIAYHVMLSKSFQSFFAVGCSLTAAFHKGDSYMRYLQHSLCWHQDLYWLDGYFQMAPWSPLDSILFHLPTFLKQGCV